MICKCVSYIVQGPSFRGEQCFIICRCNCTCNSFISYNSCNKEWPTDAFFSAYYTSHRILTVPHSDDALKLGFYGDNSCHYGIEIELEVSDILVLLNLWATNHELQKYYVITLDPTVPNGLEFVSAPMTFYYHYRYTKMLLAPIDAKYKNNPLFALGDKKILSQYEAEKAALFSSPEYIKRYNKTYPDDPYIMPEVSDKNTLKFDSKGNPVK